MCYCVDQSRFDHFKSQESHESFLRLLSYARVRESLFSIFDGLLHVQLFHDWLQHNFNNIFLDLKMIFVKINFIYDC